jgi:purine-binding chemotaxis protein CheW
MADSIIETLQQEKDEDTMSDKYLIFHLDNQQYAIAIQYVTDIINVQPVTRVPSCPEFVRGITNLRGKVIPIIDVRLRFGKPQQEYDDRTCIIVVELGEISVGMIIDSVSEVITIDNENISPPPSFSGNVDTRFVEGIGKTENGIKLILDCRTVLDDYGTPTEISAE